MEKFDKVCSGFVDQLFSADLDAMNSKIMVCIFWSLVQACAEAAHQDSSVCVYLYFWLKFMPFNLLVWRIVPLLYVNNSDI